jgi:hypothetical protein
VADELDWPVVAAVVEGGAAVTGAVADVPDVDPDVPDAGEAEADVPDVGVAVEVDVGVGVLAAVVPGAGDAVALVPEAEVADVPDTAGAPVEVADVVLTPVLVKAPWAAAGAPIAGSWARKLVASGALMLSSADSTPAGPLRTKRI